MTACCPQCQTRYRIAPEKVGPRGARLRCARCKTIFHIDPPAAPRPEKPTIEGLERVAPAPSDAAAPQPPVPDRAAGESAPAAPSGESAAVGTPEPEQECAELPVVKRRAPEPPAPAPPPQRAPAAEPRTAALLAEADPSLAKRVGDYLLGWQIDPEIVNRGSEALLRVFRSRPALAILGAHLPGVGAPAIAEVARRSELEGVFLVRIAPEDELADAPRFDAHETLEPEDFPEGLGPILERLGIGIRPAPAPPPAPEPVPERKAAPEPAPARTETPAPEPAAARAEPRAPQPAPAAPQTPAASAGAATEQPEGTSPEVAAAERLARIAVSDIILYNEEKFRAAAAAGTLPDALSIELEEARSLFEQRVSKEIRAQRDFLLEQVMARAAKL
jgi:predicted Zn finger-like uncharacterized protein